MKMSQGELSLMSGHLKTVFVSGCSKCSKSFERGLFGEKPNYSGFNYPSWEPRKGDDHKKLAEGTLKAKTKTARSELESASGVRYSKLFRLPYFDPIKGHVIDPMHNLLFGTAKHAFNVWLQ